MNKSQYKIIVFILNFLVTCAICNAFNANVYNRQLHADDDDSFATIVKNMRSDGDEDINPPDVYPSVDPYARIATSASVMVDLAFEHEYKSFMVPGFEVTPPLLYLSEEIVENFKFSLQSFILKLEFSIISMRPGPLIPKMSNHKSHKTYVPTVFVRMNITQHNSSIINPLILFHISQCSRKGLLGNMSIAEQILFPQNACSKKQVYCFPECQEGAYCDGIIDCLDTKLDEASSCPKCLYKHVRIESSDNMINADETLILECKFNSSCKGLNKKLEWQFPSQLKKREESSRGLLRVEFFPTDSITSGLYRCIVDGESSSTNITVFKKPDVSLSNADPNADTVILSEIEGRSVHLWCNATDGYARWIPVPTEGITISNYNERSSKISFNMITRHMSNSYYCNILWGTHKSRSIKKTAEVVVMCDRNSHFECKTISSKMSCIPKGERCDGIKQCADGSDESDCNYCPDGQLSVDVNKQIVKTGDTVIMECITTNRLCRPLRWWKQGRLLSGGGNIVRHQDNLFLVNVVVDDAGVYQCSDAHNKSFSNVVVHVDTGPTLRLTPSVAVFNITSGQNANISCIMDNPMHFAYKKEIPVWILENRSVLPKGVEVLHKSNTQSTIVFKRSDVSMAGQYHCQVKWGMAKEMLVKVAVRVNINPLVCKTGEKMCADRTMCVASTFWCDGIIHCLDRSDERKCVRCSKGYVFVQPSTVDALLGQAVDLQCFYDKSCYPVKWRVLSSKEPLTSNRKISIVNNRLTIHHVELQDANVYECYSGDKRSSSNVTVIRKVEVNLSSPYVFVSYGQDINVKCWSTYGKPQWRRLDLKQLSEIRGVRQSYPDPKTTTLTMISPSYDVRGFYVCFVRLSQTSKDVESNLMYVHIYDLRCPPDNIICDGNTKCVPESKVCDRVKDCEDSSDERNCSKCDRNLLVRPNQLTITTNGYGYFECVVQDKNCLPVEWKSKNGVRLNNRRFTTFENYLYVFSPEMGDFGEVTCTSGQKSASAWLMVQDLKLTILQRQSDQSVEYLMRGQNKTIICESNLGSPEWTYSNMYSVPRYGVYFYKLARNATAMKIVNARSEASRIYVCKVLFSRETKKIPLTISVL